MRMTRLLVCLWAGGALTIVPALSQTLAEQTLPAEIPWAKVTLPYAEWKSLWEAARTRAEKEGKEAEPGPPVGAVLLSAEYELVIAEDQALIDAHYRVRSLDGQWQITRLIGGDARLEHAETGEAGILWQDDGYRLLTKGQGEFNVKLRFVVSRPTQWVGSFNGLRLTPAAASLNRLRISGIPAGKAVRIEGLTATEKGEGVAI